MASVRLRLTLMLTLLARLLMDFLLLMPTPPAILTMSELLPVPLMLLRPIPDILVLDMLAMLDILAMLDLDTLVLAILVLTMVKLGTGKKLCSRRLGVPDVIIMFNQ